MYGRASISHTYTYLLLPFQRKDIISQIEVFASNYVTREQASRPRVQQCEGIQAPLAELETFLERVSPIRNISQKEEGL